LGEALGSDEPIFSPGGTGSPEDIVIGKALIVRPLLPVSPVLCFDEWTNIMFKNP